MIYNITPQRCTCTVRIYFKNFSVKTIVLKLYASYTVIFHSKKLWPIISYLGTTST